MKYILLFLSCLLYLFEFTKAFSVTFPRFKKNYAIVKNIKVNKLTDNDKKELKNIFNAVPVIVFKDQKINPQEYYDFCKIFDDNYNNLTLHPWENCAPKNVPQIALRSTHIINDATTINYKNIFEINNTPIEIDYLQIDLEVSNRSTLTTLEILDNDIFDKYKFATITFEHDIYTGNYFDTRQKSI